MQMIRYRDMNPKKDLDKNIGMSMVENEKRRLLNYIKDGCSLTYQSTIIRGTH